MGHIVKKADRWTIDIDTTKGKIFAQMAWRYNWTLAVGQAAWTKKQRKDFHTTADKLIWATWSNRVKLKLSGGNALCERFRNKPMTINWDVKWVNAGQNWDVTVRKIAPGSFLTSSVQWNARKINLDSLDIQKSVKCNDVPDAGLEGIYQALPEAVAENAVVKGALTTQVCRDQFPVAHEFGHAAGNTAVLNRGDEYRRPSPNLSDSSSILNIGDKLRSRHFDTIIGDLNTMIPDCTFSVHSIRP